MQSIKRNKIMNTIKKIFDSSEFELAVNLTLVIVPILGLLFALLVSDFSGQ